MFTGNAPNDFADKKCTNIIVYKKLTRVIIYQKYREKILVFIFMMTRNNYCFKYIEKF